MFDIYISFFIFVPLITLLAFMGSQTRILNEESGKLDKNRNNIYMYAFSNDIQRLRIFISNHDWNYSQKNTKF